MVTLTKLVCALSSTLLINMCLLIITPYYPIIAEDRGIGEMMIGIVFTMSPVFSCLFAVFIGKRISTFGRRNVACVGILANIFGLMGLTFCNSYDNTYFLIVSLVSRAIGGVGVACVYISSLSTISVEYPEKSEKYTSMMEAFGGLGLMLAPVYSSLTYSTLGFSGIFFSLAVILLIALPLLWSLNKPRPRPIVYVPKRESRVKMNRNLVLDLAVLTYCYAVLSFLEPTIGIQLTKMGVSEGAIGWVFGGMTLAYTITNFAMAWASHYIDTARLANYSGIICAISLALAGPLSQYSDQVWICILGVIFVGIGTAIAFVSVLPAMIEEITELGFDSDEDIGKITSIFSMGMNLGEISGPFASGLLSGFFGFSGSCILLCGVGLTIAITNGTLKCQNYEKRVALLPKSEIEI